MFVDKTRRRKNVKKKKPNQSKAKKTNEGDLFAEGFSFFGGEGVLEGAGAGVGVLDAFDALAAHEGHEFLEVDVAVLLEVAFLDHLVDEARGELVAEDVLQVFFGDVARVVGVQAVEGLGELVFLDHGRALEARGDEFRVGNDPRRVVVHGVEDRLDGVGVEVGSLQHGGQFLEINEPFVGSVDGPESFAELAESVVVAAVRDDHQRDLPQIGRRRVRRQRLGHVVFRVRLGQPRRRRRRLRRVRRRLRVTVRTSTVGLGATSPRGRVVLVRGPRGRGRAVVEGALAAAAVADPGVLLDLRRRGPLVRIGDE
mmetsp:Transcript_2123/g.6299  ORF Transcript_2123/g.6299 Transcript_2123/m.6299 type:complete len:312 (-) Transcript_2123:868-1803(-)